ncbi:MAG: TatD family hydrolase [Dysgonamonadaceae bacterium]|jgi:TatD DNase family protein|nr:TatD family hydrolase [Dysgonamonadaceae bacterium]
MSLIDTHAHIYQEDFDPDLEIVIARARQTGIEKILLPNIDLKSVDRMHRLADTFPDYCLPMMGLHPTSVQSDYSAVLKKLRQLFSVRKYIAVGEIGLDLHWDKTFLQEQILAFEEQLKWSIDVQLPVVIHCRDAFSYVMESLDKIGSRYLRGIFHSFGGSPEELTAILALEHFIIGVNGVLTFKNSKAEAAIRLCPPERIVVETDAPYLAPVPYRGKRNEPAYIRFTVEKLATLWETDARSVEIQTGRNACRMFGLP